MGCAAPRLWQKNFRAALAEMGLQPVSEDQCLYTSEHLMIFYFVDDLVILCRREDNKIKEQFKKDLTKRYEMRDLGGLSWFLGVRVVRDRPQKKIWLCQDSYVDKIVNRFKLQLSKPSKVPMGTDALNKHEGKASNQQILLYQRKVGSLLYATTITRPEQPIISYLNF